MCIVNKKNTVYIIFFFKYLFVTRISTIASDVHVHGLVGVQEAREAGGSEDEGRPRRVVLTQQDRHRHVALTTPVFVLVELLQTTIVT